MRVCTLIHLLILDELHSCLKLLFKNTFLPLRSPLKPIKAITDNFFEVLYLLGEQALHHTRS